MKISFGLGLEINGVGRIGGKKELTNISPSKPYVRIPFLFGAIFSFFSMFTVLWLS